MKETPTSQVGNKLRDERVRLGLTQAAAAARGGVTREQWGRYERGAMPNSKVLLKLQDSGFDVSHVLVGEREVTGATLNDDERQLLGYYRCTDDEGRAVIKRAARIEGERVSAANANPFVPREPGPPLALHDAPVKRPKSSPT